MTSGHILGQRTTANKIVLARTRKVRIHFQSSRHNQPLFLIAPVLQSLLIFYVGTMKEGSGRWREMFWGKPLGEHWFFVKISSTYQPLLTPPLPTFVIFNSPGSAISSNILRWEQQIWALVDDKRYFWASD